MTTCNTTNFTYTYGIYESHDDGNTWTMNTRSSPAWTRRLITTALPPLFIALAFDLRLRA